MVHLNHAIDSSCAYPGINDARRLHAEISAAMAPKE